MVFAKESLCFGPICDTLKTEGAGALGGIMGRVINLFILMCALAALLYLLVGAFEWITSGGEKEKIAKAQSKITNAIIGLVIVIGALTLFGVVSGNILGIITLSPTGGWIFNLPSL